MRKGKKKVRKKKKISREKNGFIASDSISFRSDIVTPLAFRLFFVGLGEWLRGRKAVRWRGTEEKK